MEAPARSDPTTRLARLWWGTVPAIVYRLSPQVGTSLADGIHTATWTLVAAAGPPLVLAAGFFLGWHHPGFPELWSESLPFLIIVAVVSVMSAALGTWLVTGFAIGDFLLADHRWPNPVPHGASVVFGGDFPEIVRLRLPLLIGYLILFLLASQLPILAKNLVAEVVGRWPRPLARPAGTEPGPRRGMVVLLVMAHAIVTCALVWAWVRAVPVLIRPRFTWLGMLAPPGSAVGPLQMHGDIVLIAAVLASIARLIHQAPLASSREAQAKFDLIQAPVIRFHRRTQPLGVARLWFNAIIGGLFATALACGILANVAEAVALLGATIALYTARSGLVPIPLGAWPALVGRAPMIVRLVAGWIAIEVLAGQILTSPLALGNPADLFRPFVIMTLLALLIVYLLFPYTDRPASTRPATPPAGEERA